MVPHLLPDLALYYSSDLISYRFPTSSFYSSYTGHYDVPQILARLFLPGCSLCLDGIFPNCHTANSFTSFKSLLRYLLNENYFVYPTEKCNPLPNFPLLFPSLLSISIFKSTKSFINFVNCLLLLLPY